METALVLRFTVMSVRLSTGISCVSQPTYEITRVAVGATLMVNLPSKSVTTPKPAEPLTSTLAPMAGSPSGSYTVPVTVMFCAKDGKARASTITKAAKALRVICKQMFFMQECFCYCYFESFLFLGYYTAKAPRRSGGAAVSGKRCKCEANNMVSDSHSVVFMRINSVFNIISVAWAPGNKQPGQRLQQQRKGILRN